MKTTHLKRSQFSDSERLDWLSKNNTVNMGLAVGGYWHKSDIRWQSNRLREAIDAAMRQDEKAGLGTGGKPDEPLGHLAAGENKPPAERLSAFRQLATDFLNSANPRLEHHFAVLNCILDYDGPLPKTRLRHMAHAFFRDAEQVIEAGTGATMPSTPQVEWIRQWHRADQK
jgi:hypothetical protein